MLETEILDPDFVRQFLKPTDGKRLVIYGPQKAVEKIVLGLGFWEIRPIVEIYPSIDSNASI